MKQIIAIGGGGFRRDDKDLSIEKYVLKQVDKKNPSVCFIPTASGESVEYTVKFYSAFSRLGCIPSHLSLFKPPTADLESFILQKDNPLIPILKEIGFQPREDATSSVIAYANETHEPQLAEIVLNGSNWYMTVGDRDA